MELFSGTTFLKAACLSKQETFSSSLGGNSNAKQTMKQSEMFAV
jgi:hypothetical protein